MAHHRHAVYPASGCMSSSFPVQCLGVVLLYTALCEGLTVDIGCLCGGEQAAALMDASTIAHFYGNFPPKMELLSSTGQSGVCRAT